MGKNPDIKNQIQYKNSLSLPIIVVIIIDIIIILSLRTCIFTDALRQKSIVDLPHKQFCTKQESVISLYSILVTFSRTKGTNFNSPSGALRKRLLTSFKQSIVYFISPEGIYSAFQLFGHLFLWFLRLLASHWSHFPRSQHVEQKYMR